MRIVLATGGSGGHLFPALELAKELRDRGHEVIFLGSFGEHVKYLKQNQFFYDELKTKGFVADQPFSFFSAGWRMVKAFFRSLKLLRYYRPSVVIGFGAHGSFASVFAAWFLRIPMMIHEQNVVPGRANRCLAVCVRKVAVSFSQTQKYFSPAKTVLTGCPTRHHKKEMDKKRILEEWRLKDDVRTLLVFGGSQGAHRINQVFFEAAELLKNDLKFQVIHVSGLKDYENLCKAYARTEIPAAVFPFLESMGKAYAVSDLVISRAGAVTVTELALFRKKAILIPYPYAKAHQWQNALVLKKTELAEILEEKDLTADRLKQMIMVMLPREVDAPAIDRNIEANFIVDSAKRLADAALSLV
ncbi:MAG TPA: undecaprenyldiphospho-muramoylpentapeptide beta-N-acetylglucosaminyltransferase [Candidatus Omnitrophota bacterium]|nr:undecaprenyldiphospho-muramoylpentapeptide beta-N-acetylglucosaminyltransferase [Candidatus Omnitrophota bacterium]